MRKYIILAIVFCSVILNAYAVNYGSIKGTVIESEKNSILKGATVRIEGTGYGAITNHEGKFDIKKVPYGNYTLLISMVGFETQKVDVILIDEELKEIDVKLGEQPLQMGEVVVSANKRVQAVQDIPISISVIDSRAIYERGNTKLDDAMKYVPGVEVNRDNVSIRGSSGFSYGLGSRVALLLDGFPLLSGDQGDIKFDALPMFNTERIEVVKGAGSALYGSSALGGVINVITKEPQEAGELRARFQTGFYTEPVFPGWKYMNGLSTVNGGDLAYTKKFGNFGLMLSGSIYQDNGYELYNKSFRYNVFTKLKYDLASTDKIGMIVSFAKEIRSNWVFWHSLDSATRPPYGTDMSSTSDLHSNKFTSIIEYSHIFDENNFLTVKGGLFGTFFENGYDPNDTTSFYRASLAYSYNADVQMNSKLSKEVFLTYGGDFTLNNVDARIFNGVTNQSIGSLYAQGEFSGIKNIILTAGARYDYEKSSGNFSNNEVSPKFGMTYNTPFGLNLRMSAGRGYRTATIAERFSRVPYAGFEVIPNPDSLHPEMSWSLEFGAGYTFKIFDYPVQVDFSIYRNQMKNLIEPQFVVGNTLQIQFKNITEAVIDGGEFSIKSFLFGFLGVESSFMLMDPRDITLNETLKYRSKFIWTNRLFIPFGKLEFQADYRYKSKYETIDARLGIQPGGIVDADARVAQHIVDSRLIYSFKSGNTTPFTVTLNVKNLFNYFYTEMVGNLGMTRQITLQLGANL